MTHSHMLFLLILNRRIKLETQYSCIYAHCTLFYTQLVTMFIQWLQFCHYNCYRSCYPMRMIPTKMRNYTNAYHYARRYTVVAMARVHNVVHNVYSGFFLDIQTQIYKPNNVQRFEDKQKLYTGTGTTQVQIQPRYNILSILSVLRVSIGFHLGNVCLMLIREWNNRCSESIAVALKNNRLQKQSLP